MSIKTLDTGTEDLESCVKNIVKCDWISFSMQLFEVAIVHTFL